MQGEEETYIPVKKRRELTIKKAKQIVQESWVQENNDSKHSASTTKLEDKGQGSREELSSRQSSKKERKTSLLDRVLSGKKDEPDKVQKLAEEEAKILEDLTDQRRALKAVGEIAKNIRYTEPIQTSWKAPKYLEQVSAQQWEQLRRKYGISLEGEDTPPMCFSFREMKFPKPIRAALKEMKVTRPTPIQMQGLPIALSGRDLIGIASTGSGKTIVFLLPLLMMVWEAERKLSLKPGEGPLGLIICPSRELASQIYENALRFLKHIFNDDGTVLRCILAIGGVSIREQLENIREGVHICVGTPGRLHDLLKRKKLHLESCRFVCLDEADRLIDLGFEEDIRGIFDFFVSQRQSLMFSATMPKKIQTFARTALVNPILVNVGRAGAANMNVIQEVEYVRQDAKIGRLLECLQKTAPPVLIFCENKNDVDDVHEYLLLKGVFSAAVHGGKEQEERRRAIAEFQQGKKDVLVATDIAAKGLDFPDIQHVINYDMPKDIEDYVHRIGRTGRRGKRGLATTFVNSSTNISVLLDLKELLIEAKQKVAPFLENLDVHHFALEDVGGVRGCAYCGGLGHRVTTCPKLESEKLRAMLGISGSRGQDKLLADRSGTRGYGGEWKGMQAKDEEVAALKAIFGEDLIILDKKPKKNGKKKKEKVLEIKVSPLQSTQNMRQFAVWITFRLSPKYPTQELPIVSIRNTESLEIIPLSQCKLKELRKHVAEILPRYQGRVCIYDIVESIREKLVEWNNDLNPQENIVFPAEEEAKNKVNDSFVSSLREDLVQKEEERRAEEEYALERNARKRFGRSLMDPDSLIRTNSSYSEGSNLHNSSQKLREILSYVGNAAVPEAFSSDSEQLEVFNDVVFTDSSEETFLDEQVEENIHMEADEREELFIRHVLRSLLYYSGLVMDRQQEDLDLSDVQILEEIFGDIRLDHLNDWKEVERFKQVFWVPLRKAMMKKGRKETVFWSILLNATVYKRDLGNYLRPFSRYREDFEYLRLLGRGGFGSVMKVRNKLDGRIYALKRVALTERLLQERHILREVTTLSRLSHPHVVRYHHAWLESGSFGQDSLDRRNTIDGQQVVAYLYIQMEYCRRTLREFIDHVLDKNEDLWSIFRQIVEGLHHIHNCGILHRDLKPTNIFFDSQGTIKIGDFGLAKEIVSLDGVRTTPERMEYAIDSVTPKKENDSFGEYDRTGGIGTLYYRAPELEENETPTYDNKVDIYSLGIIGFELWHGPFDTAMERHEVLMRLRQSSVPDPDFQARLPRQSKLIRSLLARDPIKRPSASQILDGDYLPPKVEDEYVGELLRRMSDPSSRLYMKALSNLFQVAPLWSSTVNEESFLFPETKILQSASSSVHMHYSKVLDSLEDIIRNIFLKYGGLPFRHHSCREYDDYNSYGEEDSESHEVLLRCGKKMSLFSTFRRHMQREYQRFGNNLKLFEIGDVWDLEENGFWSDDYVSQLEPFALTTRNIREYRVAEWNAFYSSSLLIMDSELLSLSIELCEVFRMHYGRPVTIRLSHTDLLPAILSHCGLYNIFHPKEEVVEKFASMVSLVLSSAFYKGNNHVIKRELMAVISNVKSLSNQDTHQKRLVQRTVEKLCSFALLRGNPRTVIAQLLRLFDPTPGEPFASVPKAVNFAGFGVSNDQTDSLSVNSRSPHRQSAVVDKKSILSSQVVYAPAAKPIEAIVEVLWILESIPSCHLESLILDPVLFTKDECFNGIIFEIATRAAIERSNFVFIGYGGHWNSPHSKDSQAQWHTGVSKHSWESLGMSICLDKLVCKDMSRRFLLSSCDVFIMSIGGDGLLTLRFSIVCELRFANIKAEFLAVSCPSLQEQAAAAKACGAQWMVLVREHVIDEHSSTGDMLLKVKSLNGKFEAEVSRKNLASYLSSFLNHKESLK
eukprot:jgi/Galph1/2667/GphlegSOOS_G1354.1